MTRAPFRSLSVRITAGVVATVLVISCGSFLFLRSFYRREMIASLADSATVHGNLIEQSLRYAMRTRSPALLAEMVRRFGEQGGVENVAILDTKGVIRFSSNGQDRGRTLRSFGSTFVNPPQTGAAAAGNTLIFTTGDGRPVFRNVSPILNTSECFGCHSSHDRVNGALVVDYSMAGIQSSLAVATRKIWLTALALALATTVVIVGLMRRLVVNRLSTLVQAVDSAKAGRVDALVRVSGADEITRLGEHLDSMTLSLSRSLSDLGEREAFLDAIINSADDGIVVIDEHMRVVTANRAFARMLGTPLAQVPGQPCKCVASCTGGDPEGCPASSTFKTGQVARRVRTVAAPDATARYYEISSSPVCREGATKQVIEVWRDITARREIEAQLANSDRLASLGLLAAGLSHEINNPLASITTCLDGLSRRKNDGGLAPAELADYLALMKGEVSRCSTLLERFKVLGRPSQPMSQIVDLAAVIRDTVALVHYMAEERRVEIRVRAAANLHPVIADEQQIRQVFLNLALNAIQAVEGPGWLHISTRPGNGATVAVEVADSGRGIAPAQLPRIFEPFYSSRPDGRGSGLGLFIAKVVVEQSGGSIEVSSSPGEPTRFTVVLPAASAAAEGAAG